MPILEQIDLAELRSEPRVWISKLALFESLDPLTPIREPITFSTGLNIVWGVENEANDEQFEPGHGVGKTTLCRLIRYCLGEPGFGQAHAVKEIQFTFPDGCVAAEVQIDGRRWAVIPGGKVHGLYLDLCRRHSNPFVQRNTVHGIP